MQASKHCTVIHQELCQQFAVNGYGCSAPVSQFVQLVELIRGQLKFDLFHLGFLRLIGTNQCRTNMACHDDLASLVTRSPQVRGENLWGRVATRSTITWRG